MLYNKNNVRKTNDKKILHKVGKQWKVVSVALLMAIGGGAAVAATNNNANAQSTNGASVGVQSEAADLENDNYKAPQSASASSQAPSSSAKAPSLANVNYAPSARVYGNNASAASYHNHANFDQARIDYYGPTVKHYVNSINAKYPEANSLENDVTSANNTANNDNSLASSYAATAKDPATSSVVSGLALKAGLTTSAYIDSVMYRQQGYASSVSQGSDNVSAMSYAASLATAILNGNPTLSDASASAALDDAKARLGVASATASAHNNVVDAVSSANSVNVSALSSAQSQSFAYAQNANVARIFSGIDAGTVNSAAQLNSMSNGSVEANWNSSAVSSAVSSVANSFNSANSSKALNFNLGNYSYTFVAPTSSSMSDMYRVISDTAALSAQAKYSAYDGSVIASAEAYKAAHANDLSSADAQTRNDAANLSAANNAVVSAGINYAIASVVSSGVNAANGDKVAFANGALNLVGENDYSALKNDAIGDLENNPQFADLKTKVANDKTKVIKDAEAAYTKEGQAKAVTAANNYVHNHANDAQYRNNLQGLKNDAKLAGEKAANEVKANAPQKGESLSQLENDPLIGNEVTGEVNDLKNTVKADLANLNINVSALKQGNLTSFANDVRAAETSSANNATVGTMTNLSNAVSLAQSSAASSYNSVVSASNNYSDVTDEDVTLASYFASSYTSEANSAADLAASDASALNSYYVATANNADFTNAFNNYNVAKGEISNEKTLAHAFGVNVLHHCPQFVTVTKNAVLHTGVGFTKKNAVKSVKAGAQLAVKGVGFDEVGTLRYVVGTDDGQPVYLTANDAYVENSYLEPDGAATVKFNKSANAHKGLNFNSKVVGSVKAGQTVTGNIIATLSDNSYDHYFGVARLQLSDGSFVTANKSYFSVIPTAKNNNNDHSESYKANNNYNRDLVLFK